MSTLEMDARPPSEVEAWKTMMSNMVKFIDASTILMQTITGTALGIGASSTSLPCDQSVCPPDTDCDFYRNVARQAQSGEPICERISCEKMRQQTQGEPSDNLCSCEKPGAELPPEKKVKLKCTCAQKGGPCGVVGAAGEKEKGKSKCSSADEGGPCGGGGAEEELCSCKMGPTERKKLTQELAAKLTEAQEQLSTLQSQMKKLQADDHPTAALYKQIMKEDSVPLDISISTRSTGPGQPGRPLVYPGAARQFLGTQNFVPNEMCTNNTCLENPKFSMMGPQDVPRKTGSMSRTQGSNPSPRAVKLCYTPETPIAFGPTKSSYGPSPSPRARPVPYPRSAPRPMPQGPRLPQAPAPYIGYSADVEDPELSNANYNANYGMFQGYQPGFPLTSSPRSSYSPGPAQVRNRPQQSEDIPPSFYYSPVQSGPVKPNNDYVNSSFLVDSQLSFTSACSAESCESVCYRGQAS